MRIKTFIFVNIFNLFFTLQVIGADTTSSKISNQDSSKSTPANSATLLEKAYSYPEGFSDFDLIGKVLAEEKKYQMLDSDGKNEYLYNKYEKIKSFSEKQIIKKFLNFDFKTGSINNLSNDITKKLNRHLPYYTNEARLKSQAFQAAALGDLPVLRALLDNKKIDINITDSNDITLLMYATKNNQIDMVRFLIAYGIDVKRKDKLGNSALAYTSPNSSIYNLLTKFGIE